MPASLVNSGTFNFADGNGGHVCDLGSTPNVGETDVLFVNSNTVVTTPSGFLANPTAVGGQGAYIYRRKAAGGEGSTVTITTSGNHDTAVGWQRWSGLDTADTTVATTAATNGSSTPAHSTGTLAAANEVVLAFGALHGLGAPPPTTPVWSAGYTGQTSVAQGTGSSGVTNYTAYKNGAGTAAETPSVSWTNVATDRYMLTISFTVTGGQSAAAGTAAETDSAQAVGRTKTRTLGVAADAATAGTSGRLKTRAVGPATDTAGAGTVAATKTRAVGLAAEADTAGQFGMKLGLNTAVEVDSARPITRLGAVAPVAAQRAGVIRGPQRASAVRGPQRATVVRDS